MTSWADMLCTVSVSKCQRRSWINKCRILVACTCEIDKSALVCICDARICGRLSVDRCSNSIVTVEGCFNLSDAQPPVAPQVNHSVVRCKCVSVGLYKFFTTSARVVDKYCV